MNALFCHNYYKLPGGESQVFDNEVKYLLELGHEISVYTQNNQEIDKYSLYKRVQLISRGYYSGETGRVINTIINNCHPEFGYIQNTFPLISPSIYSVLKKNGIPIIQSVFNYRLICPAAELYTHGEICERCVKGGYHNAALYRCYRGSFIQSAWYASIIGLHKYLGTFNNIDRFIVPDKFLGRKLVEGGFSAEKIRVNSNPINVETHKANVSHDRYFLYVGRFIPQKGVFTAIKAMQSVKSTLFLVGQGNAENQMEGLISKLNVSNRVKILPPKWGKPIEELINNCTAVIIPSEWYDNLPQILCMANACGKPVIASSINGIPEYVTEGENGWLFAPGDSYELASKMNAVQRMNKMDYEHISMMSREYAKRVFDYTVHYQRLLAIIEELGLEYASRS